MKVKDAIAMLSTSDPDDNVIIGWWSKELFSEDFDFGDDVWEEVCEMLNTLTDRANEDTYEEIVWQLEKRGATLREDN